MENTFVMLGMWLVPPMIFILAGVLLVYSKGYCTTAMEEDPEGLNGNEIGVTYLLGTGIITPVLCLLYYHFILNLSVSFGGMIGYVMFELVGSWVVYGIFTLAGIHSWFNIKEKHLRQKLAMNVNFDTLDAGQYVVRTKKSRGYTKPYRLELMQVHIQQDLTGSYKILLDVEEWGNEQFWTEDEVKKTLSDFFKARNIFQVDNKKGLAIVKVEQNKPKIIVIE